MTSEPNVAPVVDDVDDSLNSDVVEDTIEPSTETSATLRPSGKRTRKTVASGETVEKQTDASESTDTKKSKSQTSKKAQDSSVNPFVFVYTYLKQVVAELRKVIWPNRKQMITYTSIVLAFLIFMVILVAASDFGFTKLVMLVFGA